MEPLSKPMPKSPSPTLLLFAEVSQVSLGFLHIFEQFKVFYEKEERKKQMKKKTSHDDILSIYNQSWCPIVLSIAFTVPFYKCNYYHYRKFLFHCPLLQDITLRVYCSHFVCICSYFRLKVVFSQSYLCLVFLLSFPHCIYLFSNL